MQAAHTVLAVCTAATGATPINHLLTSAAIAQVCAVSVCLHFFFIIFFIIYLFILFYFIFPIAPLIISSSIFSSCVTIESFFFFLQDMSSSMKDFDHLSDVVLVCEGKRFRAHKFVLASRCKFFAAMLGGRFAESRQTEVCVWIDTYTYACVRVRVFCRMLPL